MEAADAAHGLGHRSLHVPRSPTDRGPPAVRSGTFEGKVREFLKRGR